MKRQYLYKLAYPTSDKPLYDAFTYCVTRSYFCRLLRLHPDYERRFSATGNQIVHTVYMPINTPIPTKWLNIRDNLRKNYKTN